MTKKRTASKSSELPSFSSSSVSSSYTPSSTNQRQQKKQKKESSSTNHSVPTVTASKPTEVLPSDFQFNMANTQTVEDSAAFLIWQQPGFVGDVTSRSASTSLNLTSPWVSSPSGGGAPLQTSHHTPSNQITPTLAPIEASPSANFRLLDQLLSSNDIQSQFPPAAGYDRLEANNGVFDRYIPSPTGNIRPNSGFNANLFADISTDTKYGGETLLPFTKNVCLCPDCSDATSRYPSPASSEQTSFTFDDLQSISSLTSTPNSLLNATNAD
jgi:hypothetical protein